jgi:hypothetical protein
MPKTVAFHSVNKTYEIPADTLTEHMRDVERVTETLIKFLKTSLRDNIFHLGQHRKGHENDDRSFDDIFEIHYVSVTKKVLQVKSDADLQVELGGIYETMYDYIEKPTAYLLRDLFKLQASFNRKSDKYRRLHWCAIIVILIGLGTFLQYGHCVNKCADALSYSEDRDEIRYSPWGKDVPELASLCLKSHRQIEDALGWDDIRDMDRLLQEASQIARRGAKVCSLAFRTPEVAMKKLGPLSGTKSNIISTNVSVDGQKYHTTRRGTKYMETSEGLLKRVA